MNPLFQSDHVQWIDFENPPDSVITALKEQYNIDSLVLEDSMEVGHLPKYEKMEEWEFLLVRFYSKSNSFYQNILREFSNKIAIFFRQDTIITIHQHPIPFLTLVRERIEKMPKEKVTFRKVLYHLLSQSFESYEIPYHKMSHELEKYENQLFLSKNSKLELKNIYQLKREANSCRKILSITRDILDEYLAYHKKQAYIQDVYELNLKLLHQFNQVVEDIQNLLNMYISVSSQRSNEIMKLLTIFSAFFLPLTFIVGVYGMNFRNMPEIEWKFGYVTVWTIMIIVVLVIYFWFKKRKIL